MTDDTAWYCGAFQPTPPDGMKPYRCTEPSGHTGDHRAVVDGSTVATWHRWIRRTR